MKLSNLILEEYQEVLEKVNSDVNSFTQSVLDGLLMYEKAHKSALYMEQQIEKASVDIDELEEEWDANK